MKYLPVIYIAQKIGHSTQFPVILQNVPLNTLSLTYMTFFFSIVITSRFFVKLQRFSTRGPSLGLRMAVISEKYDFHKSLNFPRLTVLHYRCLTAAYYVLGVKRGILSVNNCQVKHCPSKKWWKLKCPEKASLRTAKVRRAIFRVGPYERCANATSTASGDLTY